jgi:hypothetical protein
MIDVDVPDVRGKVRHQLPPPPVRASEKVNRQASESIVLIVVVRHERVASRLERRFVVRGQISKIAPPEFVHHLALGDEALLEIQGFLNEMFVTAAIVPGWSQKGHYPTIAAPVRGRIHEGRIVDPRQRGIRHFVRREGDNGHVSLPFPALEFMLVSAITWEEFDLDETVLDSHSPREVLPELWNRNGQRTPSGVRDDDRRRTLAVALRISVSPAEAAEAQGHLAMPILVDRPVPVLAAAGLLMNSER